MDNPVPMSADDLYREEVLRGRVTLPAEKFYAGADLFEYACEITRAGIREQFPQLDDAGVERILGERLRLARRLKERS